MHAPRRVLGVQPVEPEKSIAAVIGGNSSTKGRKFIFARSDDGAQRAVNLFLCGFNTGPRVACLLSFSLHKTAHPFGRENVKMGARLDGGGRRVINSENGARYYVKLHDVTADSGGPIALPRR